MTGIKKTLLCAVVALISITTFAQSGSGFGLKGGLNYNGNGDYFESIGDAAREPDRNLGFHIGLYGKVDLGRLYVRPELFYTQTKSDYEDESFNLKKIDLPVLLGLKIFGPIHVFAGPSFQYILDTEYEGITIDDVDNDFTVGLHFGAGVNLGKLGIDLRYERGFGENEATFINTNITTFPQSRIDTRPEQLILSLSLKL